MKLTAGLVCLLLFLASCEALGFVAKPVVERTVEVIRSPEVADRNLDKKTSFTEILAYILGITLPIGGVAAAAYAKANRAQKDTDEQWVASARAGQFTDTDKSKPLG